MARRKLILSEYRFGMTAQAILEWDPAEVALLQARVVTIHVDDRAIDVPIHDLFNAVNALEHKFNEELQRGLEVSQPAGKVIVQ